jgi:hypothetical protein
VVAPFRSHNQQGPILFNRGRRASRDEHQLLVIDVATRRTSYTSKLFPVPSETAQITTNIKGSNGRVSTPTGLTASSLRWETNC